MNEAIKAALRSDRTIDIITKGAKTGLPRKTEIWFCNIGGRIIICGTPDAEGKNNPRARRDWLANLKANPEFLFCLKESLTAELPARAVVIVDPDDRRQIMSAPETKWYRAKWIRLRTWSAVAPSLKCSLKITIVKNSFHLPVCSTTLIEGDRHSCQPYFRHS